MRSRDAILRNYLNEPLFQNELITVDNQPLANPDWASSGITQIKDICFQAIPGYLPTRASYELLTEQEDEKSRTLFRTTRELNELNSAIPNEWTLQINSQNIQQSSDLQPLCVVRDANPNNASQDILSCKTRAFYGQLLKDQQTTMPAIHFWKENLRPEPIFNTKQWKTLYSPLILRKHGDINWKIAHSATHSAIFQQNWRIRDPKLSPMWHYRHIRARPNGMSNRRSILEIQSYVNQLTSNKLFVNTTIKLLGLVKRNNDTLEQTTVDLLNWTLTVARWAIHKSAVNYRVRNMAIPPEALFRASIVKSHFQFQYKLYVARHTQYYFPYHWYIGETFAKIGNDNLVFTL